MNDAELKETLLEKFRKLFKEKIELDKRIDTIREQIRYYEDKER